MPLAGLLEGFDRQGMRYLTFRLSTKREHYYVGRQADAVDICLEHESISRRHAQLTVTAVGVLISDLDAAHGTFVKGLRLKPHVATPLEDGAEIRFAGSSRKFRFRSAASVAADAALGGAAAAGGWGAALAPSDGDAGERADASRAAPPPTSLFPPPPLNEPLFKAVAHLLRTVRADGASGYRLRPDGFAVVGELVKTTALSTYYATVHDIDDLERAALVGGQRVFERRDEAGLRLVRARAGHAPAVRVNPALELRALALGELGELGELVHATYFRHWNAIRAAGLDAAACGGVVCFGTELPARGAVLAGMARRPEVLVCVDAQAMLVAGMRFFRDGRGAVCTGGDEARGRVALEFATRVLNASNGAELLDEEEVRAERERAGVCSGPAPRPPAPAQAAKAAKLAPVVAAAVEPPKPRFNPYLAADVAAAEGPSDEDEDTDRDGRQRGPRTHPAARKRGRLG
jgi:RNA:NAD 2'-phosphotransferase (TPT1/KptA family)